MRCTSMLIPVVGVLLAISAGGEALAAPDEEQVTVFQKDEKTDSVVVHSTMGSSAIKNWKVIDNRTLMIETYGHGDLIATFMQPCYGLRAVEFLGFSTFGPFELDKSTKVVLPDGRQCHFKELKRYVPKEDPEGEP